MGVPSNYIRGVEFNLSSLTELSKEEPKFTRTGYTFQHWKDSNGMTYSDEQAVTFDLPEVNLSAVWEINKYKVSWTTPLNGSITVTAGGSVVENGSNVNYGTVLTITATPDIGYKLNSLKVNGNDFVSGNTFTVGTDPVVIAATFNDNTGIITYYPGY